LNKTLRVGVRKIKWVRSLVLVAIAMAVVGSLGVGLILAKGSDRPTVEVDGRRFTLDIADTDDEREQGLSGRENMSKDDAMLFIFDDSSEQCMWMKDMHFNLDMVWLDNTKRIVHIENNLSPQTYPKSYCSQWPSKYVIELNSGTSKELGLRNGQQVQLNL
jgi:uncharacterized membrane protein (UPF0127 family)